MRCIRLEPEGGVPRIVLPTLSVSARKRSATDGFPNDTSPRAREDQQLDPSSEHGHPFSAKPTIEAECSVDTATSRNTTTRIPTNRSQPLHDADPESARGIEPADWKRQAYEGETSSCVRSRPLKRSKKRVALKDARALIGMKTHNPVHLPC
jgi:hypothetical protein